MACETLGIRTRALRRCGKTDRMAEPLADQAQRKLTQAASLNHRLILIVASSGAGKTAALRDLYQRTGFPVVNVGLELSLRMLELTHRQRALQVEALLRAIVEETDADVAMLDNTEILFDMELKQDPLRLLQGLSRNRTIVACWNGAVADGFLTYASSGHGEYRRYSAQNLLLATVEAYDQKGVPQEHD